MYSSFFYSLYEFEKLFIFSYLYLISCILCSVQQQLSTYDGENLFKLSKAKLEMMFGSDEGGRLYSQILVQRNRSGVIQSSSLYEESTCILCARSRVGVGAAEFRDGGGRSNNYQNVK